MRSLNDKVENVLELIQKYKIDVMLIAETWHNLKSISLSKLRSLDLVVFEKTRPRLPESVYTPFTSLEKKTVGFDSTFQRMLLKVAPIVSFEHLCLRISSNSKSVIAQAAQGI